MLSIFTMFVSTISNKYLKPQPITFYTSPKNTKRKIPTLSIPKQFLRELRV